MARKTTIFEATNGRDKGKKFLITEMSAADVEDWAANALFLLMGAGVEMPEEDAQIGMAGMLKMGISAIGKIPYEQAKPLLARMMDCVEIMPDPRHSNVRRALMDEDIEEVKTRFQLRQAIWELHVDFSDAAEQ